MTQSVTPRSVVRSYYDRVDAGEIDELVSLFAPDVVYDRPGHPRIEGREALERFYREVRPLSEGRHSLRTIIADDEELAVRGTFEGLQDGTVITLGFADFFRFDEDTRIQYRYTYTDRDTV